MTMPSKVRIYEVGPRDGLQAEKQSVSTEEKIELIERLAEAGIKSVESGAFVSPKWVPQMADSVSVLRKIKRKQGTSYPVLTPNMKGFYGALEVKADEIALFSAASETFSQKNTNCSIRDSLERAKEVAEAGLSHGMRIRGYISCALGCPYEGEVNKENVVVLAKTLREMGCYEISLGDTIGVGTPHKAKEMLSAVASEVPIDELALHFHDSYGQALANILACLELGVSTIDTAVSGLGGCPYAPGASGNVATEDVLYMLDGLGIETAISFDEVIKAGQFICKVLGRKTTSKVAQAYISRANT
ncbi:MAG: hydroxymethylglutaryl-CoA lyase [Alphaproteobacteria bacterium]|jgi:hydroxymethylglutaryl-CoA lyase|nr:hydroxymethylglutaryl-CoA lyase [Alphaproteobacteria bacterium]PPR13174.1 MAG: 3-hydroxy-3-isohexenylglutaryl-CoA/hydroxy-methylglutaryl-CoA lyase [Alphaproteobacteria bacterium MarineAlpha12_Bin1]|tara:strand:+ start:11491 stop:12399 length:909 start_codon:yes stop_codon:yes gene_type:complete